jgi:serine phosphatase RsbU (regulator of sigma subunit)/CHASE3 domain sensor protein
MLIVGYFIVLVVIAAATVPTLIGTLQALNRQHATYDVASAGATDLLVSALNQETGVRGYVLNGESAFLQPYELGASQYMQATKDLQSVHLRQPFGHEVTSTLHALENWRVLASEAITDVQNHDLAAARTATMQTTAKLRFDEFRHQQSLLSKTVESDLLAGRNALEGQVVLSIVVLSIALGVGVILGIGIWVWWRLSGRRYAQAELELADRAVLLQAAIDASSDSLYAKDLEGRHILANRARAFALSGGDADTNLIGRRVDDFVEAAVAADIRKNEELVLRTGSERQFQEILPFPDGPHVFSMTKSPLKNAHGDISGTVGIARDITNEIALLEDRERLYQLEHRLAQTLQLSMIGSDHIDDSRLDVCARYAPAANELAVGGDWYDTLPMPDGRIALIVGDAVGHGLGSITAMGQMRSALAALINLASDPAGILETFDRFAWTLPGARSSTCLLVFIDPAQEQITYSCAGHMPPIVISPSGAAELLESCQDAPLAVKRAQARRNTTVAFPVGSVVVLYTDGLVERRNELIDVGIQRLIDRLRDMVDPAVDELCDRVIERLVSIEHQDDDVAMIAARLTRGNKDGSLSDEQLQTPFGGPLTIGSSDIAGQLQPRTPV